MVTRHKSGSGEGNNGYLHICSMTHLILSHVTKSPIPTIVFDVIISALTCRVPRFKNKNCRVCVCVCVCVWVIGVEFPHRGSFITSYDVYL